MTYNEALQQVDKANGMIVEANRMVADAIMSVFIYSWNWWVGVAMLVIPWLIWAVVRNKESSARLFCAGLFVMVFSAVFDTLGIENGLWAYPVKVIPTPTVSFVFHISLLPVITMLLIQYKPRVNPLLKAAIFSALAAFVGLPLLAAIDLYKIINWAFTYSFFTLIVMYFIAYWLYQLNSYEKVKTRSVRLNRDFRLNILRRKAKIR